MYPKPSERQHHDEKVAYWISGLSIDCRNRFAAGVGD